MKKAFLKIVAIFIIGFSGGLLANYYNYSQLKGQIDNLITEKNLLSQKMCSDEKNFSSGEKEDSLKELVGRVEKSVVGIRTETRNKKVILGSGFVITSDGLIITLADIVPPGEKFVFWINGKEVNYQVLKRDLKNNLALIRIKDDSGFLTTPFVNPEDLLTGEKIFVLGLILFNKDKAVKIVNTGIIRSLELDEDITTNIKEDVYLKGGPVFDFKGKFIGLAEINKEGELKIIPPQVIHQFIGF